MNKVLIVDDEGEIRRLVAHVLRNQGYSIAEAANGHAALDCLRKESFDLVITDLQMPGMGGEALIEECRTMYPDTDFIVLTAHGTIQSAVQAMKRGAADFLTKPFEIADLIQKVAYSFDRRRNLPEERQGPPSEPLVELSRILSSQIDSSEVLESVFDFLQRTFEPARSEMTIFDGHQGDAVIAQRNGSPEELGYPRPMLQELQRVAGTPEPWLLRDAGPVSIGGQRVPSGLGITVPLLMGEEVAGTLTLVRHASSPRYTRTDAQLLQVLGFQIAISVLHDRMRQRLVETFQNLRQANLSATQTLFAAIETYDQYTHDHSERVSRFAYELGRRMHLADQQLENLRIGGLLHDIGKLGVGDETLHKNGHLTPTEYERVRLHPVMGARILSGVQAFAEVVPLILHHHERYDGQGYPDHLPGQEIPSGARIIAIVDAYDSMTSDRPYRPALSWQEALMRLREAAGTQFDGELVEAWSTLISEQQASIVSWNTAVLSCKTSSRG